MGSGRFSVLGLGLLLLRKLLQSWRSDLVVDTANAHRNACVESRRVLVYRSSQGCSNSSVLQSVDIAVLSPIYERVTEVDKAQCGHTVSKR